MRWLIITVPAARSNDVVDVLQDECELKNVSRYTEDDIATVLAVVPANVTGFVMYQLDLIGVGVAYGKVILLPVAVVKPLPRPGTRTAVVAKAQHWRQDLRASSGNLPVATKEVTPITSTMQELLDHKVTRLAVEEMYAIVADGCHLSIDYMLYIIVAGMISAVGLATNNAVMIVASMLVSPLMGPILGFTFGTAIWDMALIKKGLYCEVVGVFLTCMVGFIVGLVIAAWPDVPVYYDWPTAEMASRGSRPGLLVGLFFALPSGAGVALSVTQGGVNTLVGVAIAASLLPPVVNVGMCLGYAAAGANRQAANNSELDYDAQTFLDIAGISLSLFLLNIVCIFFVSLILFWFKKVRPVRRQLSGYTDLPPINTRDPAKPTFAGAVPVVMAAKVTAAAAAASGTPTTALSLALSSNAGEAAAIGTIAVSITSTGAAAAAATGAFTARSAAVAMIPPLPTKGPEQALSDTQATQATQATLATSQSGSDLEAAEASLAPAKDRSVAATSTLETDLETDDGDDVYDDTTLELWAQRIAPTASKAVLASLHQTTSLRAEVLEERAAAEEAEEAGTGGRGVRSLVDTAVTDWVADQQHVAQLRARWKEMVEERQADEEARATARKGRKQKPSKTLQKLGEAEAKFQIFLGKVRDKVVTIIQAEQLLKTGDGSVRGVTAAAAATAVPAHVPAGAPPPAPPPTEASNYSLDWSAMEGAMMAGGGTMARTETGGPVLAWPEPRQGGPVLAWPRRGRLGR